MGLSSPVPCLPDGQAGAGSRQSNLAPQRAGASPQGTVKLQGFARQHSDSSCSWGFPGRSPAVSISDCSLQPRKTPQRALPMPSWSPAWKLRHDGHVQQGALHSHRRESEVSALKTDPSPTMSPGCLPSSVHRSGMGRTSPTPQRTPRFPGLPGVGGLRPERGPCRTAAPGQLRQLTWAQGDPGTAGVPQPVLTEGRAEPGRCAHGKAAPPFQRQRLPLKPHRLWQGNPEWATRTCKLPGIKSQRRTEWCQRDGDRGSGRAAGPEAAHGRAQLLRGSPPGT